MVLGWRDFRHWLDGSSLPLYMYKLAVWLSSLAWSRSTYSYCTPGLVSAWIGDHFIRTPPRRRTSHPGKLSLAISPWAAEMSTSESWGVTCRYTTWCNISSPYPSRTVSWCLAAGLGKRRSTSKYGKWQRIRGCLSVMRRYIQIHVYLLTFAEGILGARSFVVSLVHVQPQTS